jgi:hypothetical protein
MSSTKPLVIPVKRKKIAVTENKGTDQKRENQKAQIVEKVRTEIQNKGEESSGFTLVEETAYRSMDEHIEQLTGQF